MRKRIIAGLLLLSVALGLTSCNFRKKPRSETFYGYFDTVSTVYDYSGLGRGDFGDLVDEVKEELSYYNKLFDIYKEYEGVVNLATVNANAGGGAIKVDREMIDFLSYCKEMYYLTGGSVNIAAGSVLSIWHKHREDAGKTATTDDNKLPSMAELESAKNHTNIDNLVIDEENLTVELLDAEMSLDVGAIGKGYATERVAEELREDGYDQIVLDIGGNLKIIGEREDGGTWKTGIRNPDTTSSDPYIYYLDIKDTACVTSGGYERYYEVDGKKYHHLIDMDTLMPANHFASVTVIAFDSGLADALSSAMFIMSMDEGKALLETLDGVRVVWVEHNGNVVDSDDFDNQS